MVNLVQLQANSVARLKREADFSKLKTQRAESGKDGGKAGIHTQMEILEEALYGLAECERLEESSVKSVHDKLKVVGTVLRRRLVALEIADGVATMQNGWRSVELWEEEEEASEGVAPSKDKKQKLYSDATQSIEADNERKQVPYAGGGWKHQNSDASQGSQSYHSNI